MIDTITRSFIPVLTSRELQSQRDPKHFEKFVNYTILNKEYGNDFEFEVDNISTGNNYKGIDGIAIILNEDVVLHHPQDLDDILETNKKFNVDWTRHMK